MFSNLFNLMGMMFLLMASGAFLRKKNIITVQGKKCLTDLILYVVLPCNIIKAFCMKTEAGFWIAFSEVLVTSILIQVLCLIITKTMYGMMKPGEKAVYQYGTVCSNSSFMGNPMSQGVFGDIGLLYASIFLIPQRVVMWTAGVTYFTNKSDKKQAIKNVLTHPCMVALYIGMAIIISKVTLPTVLFDTIQSYSNCCTALTMMYIGTSLTDVDFRTIASPKQLYFAFIRLILIPVIVYLICKLVKLDPIVAGVSVLLTAMPAGSTTSLLAAKYCADEEAAAKCVVFTTAMSIITLPVWSAILMP